MLRASVYAIILSVPISSLSLPYLPQPSMKSGTHSKHVFTRGRSGGGGFAALHGYRTGAPPDLDANALAT